MGENEAKCRAWVQSLGEVPLWQALMAETAITLSALLDVEPNPAQAAAASRELRQIVGLLAPTARMGAPAADQPRRPETWSPPEDTVGNLVSLVEGKQARRA